MKSNQRKETNGCKDFSDFLFKYGTRVPTAHNRLVPVRLWHIYIEVCYEDERSVKERVMWEMKVEKYLAVYSWLLNTAKAI